VARFNARLKKELKRGKVLGAALINALLTAATEERALLIDRAGSGRRHSHIHGSWTSSQLNIV
jgi:hypothetical protein